MVIWIMRKCEMQLHKLRQRPSDGTVTGYENALVMVTTDDIT
jgi:hypothetical protein